MSESTTQFHLKCLELLLLLHIPAKLKLVPATKFSQMN